MNLKQYKEFKANLKKQQTVYRNICSQCLQPDFSCYCKQLKPFDCHISFVILIHHLEAKKRIATGRMTHLSLKNAYLIRGDNYSKDAHVNALLADPAYQSVLLYPGKDAVQIDVCDKKEVNRIFPKHKKPRIFVIDGTWATARQTFNQSHNLQKIPKIMFTPKQQSEFKVRKQPNEQCYSTLEAVHESIELLGDRFSYQVQSRQHDHMKVLFYQMIKQQIELTEKAYREKGREHCYRRLRRSV